MSNCTPPILYRLKSNARTVVTKENHGFGRVFLTAEMDGSYGRNSSWILFYWDAGNVVQCNEADAQELRERRARYDAARLSTSGSGNTQRDSFPMGR